MEHENKPLHVVLGAGQIGARLASYLHARGERVRVVRQSANKGAPGIETRHGDIRDHGFAAEATAGAAVVYDCMNPLYHQWSERLLPIASGALHGARLAGAKLVALDCLYMYGRPQGAMREDSARNPCSKKGALRVELEALRMTAHQRGDVRVAIARGSDFFGADVPLSLFSDRFYERALAGEAVECMGDPDLPHSYTYAEDVVSALALLGVRDEAMGEVWHIPTPAAESTRALADRIGRALGIARVKLRPVPTWAMRGIGLFSPMMRELAEMTYQWQVPYVLDDAKFTRTFGVHATPIERAVADTAAWARARFSPPLAVAHA